MKTGFITASDAFDEVLREYETPSKPAASTGWKGMDRLYTVAPGELTVVTGVPGHGKSEWLDQLLLNMNQAHKAKFALVSLEALPVSHHLETLAEKIIGKPFRNRLHHDRMTKPELERALAILDENFFFYNPDEAFNVLDFYLAGATVLHKRVNLSGLVLDPWNRFDHARTKDDAQTTETEYIGRCLSQIKSFALQCMIHVWLVAHPTKLRPATPGEKVPVPTPYDISGSANFFNMADNCITVYREPPPPDYQRQPGETDPTYVHVQKVKLKKHGCKGAQRFDYDYASGRYTEWSDPEIMPAKPYGD